MMITDTERLPPSYWAERGDPYDCTLFVGPLESGAPWPMYSYERPAWKLWNAIARGLYERGWTDEQIKHWLQSKGPRWELDGQLGDRLDDLGAEYAQKIARDY